MSTPVRVPAAATAAVKRESPTLNLTREQIERIEAKRRLIREQCQRILAEEGKQRRRAGSGAPQGEAGEERRAA